MTIRAVLLVTAIPAIFGAGFFAGQTVDLPTSKRLIGEIPGKPERLNSLPMTMAVSPDGRYVVTVNAGYGTAESNYDQSLAVLDTQTGKLEDFPDARTVVGAKQTLYAGLAFSRDGAHLYASMGSTTTPEGDGNKATGSGIAVYSFNAGKIAPERFIPIALQQLGPGKKTKLIGGVDGDKGVPFPADIAVVSATRRGGAERLLVADNLSDDVLLLDAATGRVEKRFDLSMSAAVPSTYPIALAVPRFGGRAFVALWNASEIDELDLANGTVDRRLPLLKPTSPTAAGTHPCAFAFSPDEKTMYVALANRDAVAAIDIGPGELQGRFSVKGYFDTRLPGQSYFGAEPEALAVNADGSRLYVANAITDAIAVIDTRKLTRGAAKEGDDRADWICANGLDADVDGVSESEERREAVCCHGERQRRGAERRADAGDGGRAEQTVCAALYLHRDAAAWVTGDAGYGGDRKESAGVDFSGDGVEQDEGG